MSKSIEAIREALAAGPTPGEWHVSDVARGLVVYDEQGWAVVDAKVFHARHTLEEGQANARLAAACNPAAIAELLAAHDVAIRERDELRGDAERYRAIRREMHEDNPRLMVVQDYFGDCGIFPAEELDAEVDALITSQNEMAEVDAAIRSMRPTGDSGVQS